MNIHYTKEDLKKFSNTFRSNLVSSIHGYKSVNLIGTISTKHITNLAIVSSTVHIGSNPALIGFFLRPIIVTRDTYHNILETKYYTINHVHSKILEKSYQTSEHLSAAISEFKTYHFQEDYQNNFLAPFVKESYLKIGLKLVEKILIKSNNTLLMIGEVQHLTIPKESILQDGNIRLDIANSICMTGQNIFYQPKFIKVNLK